MKFILPCLMLFSSFSLTAQTGGSRSIVQSIVELRANAVYNAVVDVNGGGDYTSVQEAVDQAPPGRKTPWLIFVKDGRYEGLVRIPVNKPYIHLIGQDREKVMITFKINCANPANANDSGKEFSKVNFGAHDCAVVVVDAPDFFAENISFENGYGVETQSGPQALAIKTNNDRIAFYNCWFRSFQDTWMTSTRGINDRLYVDKCWIEGAVDYFYGGGNAYVENSTLYNVRSGSVIVAPAQGEGVKWGYVFDHCIVDGNAAAADGRTKLGRPWHNQPMAVYLNTTMKIPLDPEGWTDMGPAAKLFAEYNSRSADGRPLDLSRRRTWYQQRKNEGGKRIEGLTAVLNQQQAAKYTYKNIIEDADGWNPRTFFERTEVPTNVKRTANMLIWEATDKVIGYVVYRNKEVIGFTGGNSFQLPESVGPGGTFALQAVNKDGDLSVMSESAK